MEIIVVGTGTGVPSLKRASPCMAAKVAGETLIFDTGAGSLRKLLEAGITYHDIDKLFYTHLHPDHTIELASLLFASKYPVSLRTRDLPIIGPTGIKGLYSKMLNLYGDWIQVNSYKLLLQEIWETELDYSGFKVSTKPLVHSENSIGYRVEEKASGKSFVYSGDTDYCDNIIRLAKDTDLLVLECSFPEDIKVEGHLTPGLAGKIAMEANCKRLLLTHFYPVCDNDILDPCRKVFSGQIILGEDLMRVKV